MKRLLLIFLFFSFTIFPSFAPAPAITPLTSVESVSEVVYVTKTGSKYHKSNCHYLKNSKIKTTKSEAKTASYTACSVCKP